MFNNKLMSVDVAIEIIAEIIGDNLLAIEKEKDENIIKELKEKMNFIQDKEMKFILEMKKL